MIVTVTCLYPRFIQQSLVSIGKHRSQFEAGVPASVARHIGERRISFGDALSVAMSLGRLIATATACLPAELKLVSQ